MRPDSAGWSSLVARRAHNPEVGGSNPPPATKNTVPYLRRQVGDFLMGKSRRADLWANGQKCSPTCLIVAGCRTCSHAWDALGPARPGAGGRRPPRAAGRGGSTPGSSRRPGPWWRRARDASATRRGRPRKDRSPAVDRPRDVPVAQGSRFEITWRAVGRLASRPSAPDLRRGGPPVGADVRGPVDVLGRERPPRRAPAVRDDPEGAAPAPARGALDRREHRLHVRAPPGAAPPRPVARGDEEVVRLDPARQHVGDTPASPWRRAGAPARGSPCSPRPRPGRRARGRTRPPLRPRQQPRGTGPAAQAHLGVPRGRPGRRREVAGAPRAPAPLTLPSLRPPDPRQPPLAAPSPGYLVSRAWRLPILPISP